MYLLIHMYFHWIYYVFNIYVYIYIYIYIIYNRYLSVYVYIHLYLSIYLSIYLFLHLFAILHVRWLLHVFNRIACIYQTATRWDLLHYRITVWLIDAVVLSFFLCTWWFDSSFFATAIWDGKPVDTNSHPLSHLCYKQTD